MRKVLVVLVVVMILGGGFYYGRGWWKIRNRELFMEQKKVEIVENGVIVLGVRTEAKTVGEFVEQSKIKLNKDDKVYPARDVELSGGMRIMVQKSIPVKIEVDGGEIEKNIFGRTVREAVRESGVKLNPADKVEPGLDDFVYDNLKIVITRIEHKEIVETEDIDYEVVEKKDKNLKWRTKKVKQKGKKGEREVRYLVTYKNGEEIKRKKLSSKVIKKPVPEVVVMGTKIKVGKKQRGRASWYAYTGKMAAASTTFPKGTWLRVTAVNSGKQVFVQVNDYGPDPGTGKILDLDKEAFKKLAPLGAGVIEVKIEEIR